MEPRAYSEQSELTSLFALRASGAQCSPEDTVLDLVGKLRQTARAKLGEVPFGKYLSLRNVVDVSYLPDFHHDGQIEPIGTTCMDGFRIVLNCSSRASRGRFTLAHELCHTFFYEYVPEIKFLPHTTDPVEERLCNSGAAEMLMPAKLVKRTAKGQPVCLRTLENLAALFQVSSEAMVLRLIKLRLWQVELSSWVRLSNGKFAIDKIVGGKLTDWQWPNQRQLDDAWELGKSCAGRDFIRRVNQCGIPSARPISFDLARRQNRICVLWGTGVVDSRSQGERPLFDGARKSVN